MEGIAAEGPAVEAEDGVAVEAEQGAVVEAEAEVVAVEESDYEYVTWSEDEAAGKKKLFAFAPYAVTRVAPRGPAPRARSGHRIVCAADGARLYCYGGYNPAGPSGGEELGAQDEAVWSPERPLFKELWRFAPARRRWESLQLHAELPDELASHAMCARGDNIMVFGGTGTPFGASCSNNLLVYNTAHPERGLQPVETRGELPPEHYGHAVTCVGHHFYTIGGTNGFDYTADIYRLNVRTLTWKSMYVCGGNGDGEPAGRYRHELACDGRDIYVLGGGTSISPYDLVFLYVFNIEKRSWTCLPTNLDTTIFWKTRGPLPRKCHSAVQIDTPDGIQVFIMGGTDGVKVFNDVWRLNLRTLQWTLMRKTFLPKLLYFHSSTVTPEGCMYTFGGIQEHEQASRRVNDMYKLWLCIPKLSEMCWEAMLFYNPDLDMKEQSELLNAGVPVKFAERLT